MSKGAGGTRASSWRDKSSLWNGKTDFDSLLAAQIAIFEKEARKGLGDFKSRKPKTVDVATYNRLLASGDYIEIYH